MKSLKQQRIDQLVIGFALFSMFFGAGNIIFPAVSGDGIRQLVGAGVSLLLPGRHRDRHSGDLCIDPKRRRDLYHNHTDRQSPRRDHAVCYHPLHRSLHRPSANRGYSSGNVHRTGIRRCFFMAYQRDLLSAGPAFDHSGILCRRYHRQDPDSRSGPGIADADRCRCHLSAGRNLR